jgi:hypothetical protein
MDVFAGKALSRRTVLRGMGTALSLPFLQAMAPARFSLHGQSSAAGPVHRFQTVYAPNGMAMEYWSPKGVGRDFELSPILEPMAPFRDQMTVISGLNATWVNAHNGASGAFLTGCTHGAPNYTEFLADTSMDQLLAREIGRETQLDSMQLSTDPLPVAGGCTGGLSCIYQSTISWRTPTQPLVAEHNPRAVFEMLFGDSGSTSRAAREARLVQKKSILDSVVDKLGTLKREVGAEDQIRLDQYSEAVRAVERRIQVAEEQLDVDLPNFEQPAGIPADFEDHLELLLDMQLLAFQADLTRVTTMMLAREISARTYPQVGVPESHHPLSHHNNRADLIAHMSKINVYHARLFANYVEKLRATPDGDGTLLDHMTILYGSGISNSSQHSGISLPVVVVGGGAGKLNHRGGQHLQYDGVPMPNLLVTLMDKFGVPVDHIGASSGPLELDTISEI